MATELVPKGTGSQRTVCATCGHPLRRPPCRIKDRNYCDPICRSSDPNAPKRRQRADTGTKKSAWIDRPCGFCGTLVSRRVSDTRPHSFCSRSCFRKSEVFAGRIVARPSHVQIGTRKPGSEGYVQIYIGIGHPYTTRFARGWAAEHRYVMMEHLGRKLLTGENVHHVDGNRTNNAISNLELWVTKQPKGQRVEDLLCFAREIIATYAPVEAELAALRARMD